MDHQQWDLRCLPGLLCSNLNLVLPCQEALRLLWVHQGQRPCPRHQWALLRLLWVHLLLVQAQWEVRQWGHLSLARLQWEVRL